MHMSNLFLCLQYPAPARKTALPSKKKRYTKMALGTRNSKRVRAGQQPDEQSSQTQRRTSKRLSSSETDVHNEEQPAEEDIEGTEGKY